ncbi:MAG: TolC family protein [Campylobacterales bacterium]|nr:TolC family protein [Campylobacterales bacterium]
MNHKIICLLSVFVVGGICDDTLLNEQKSAIIDQKKVTIEKSKEALKYNWLAPLNLSVSSDFEGTSQANASISQDIFRSGGIYYAMKYADDRGVYENLSLEQEVSVYEKQIHLAVLNIKKYQFELEKLSYLIKNSEITVFLKQKQYESGDVDITELSDAIRAKNIQKTSYLLLKQQLQQERLELKKYTDIDADNIDIPKIEFIDKLGYIDNNFNVNLLKYQNNINYDTYKTTLSSYLPSISLSANANYTDANGFYGDDYNFGVKLSIPISYTSFASIEEKRSAFLESKAKEADATKEEQLAYEQSMILIERYKDTNKVLEENIAEYNSILEITKEAYENGYKAGYDVGILQNSIKSDELEIKINEINIDLELTKLYFNTKRG